MPLIKPAKLAEPPERRARLAARFARTSLAARFAMARVELEGGGKGDAVVLDEGFDGPCLVTPGRFSKFLVRWPLFVMFITGTTSVLLCGLAFAGGGSDLGGSFTDTCVAVRQRGLSSETPMRLGPNALWTL